MVLAHGGGVFFVRDRNLAPSDGDTTDRHYSAYTLSGPVADANITMRLESIESATDRKARSQSAYPVFAPGTRELILNAARTAHKATMVEFDDADETEAIFQQIRFYDRIIDSGTMGGPHAPVVLEEVGDALTRPVSGGAAPATTPATSLPAAYTYFGQFLAHDMSWMKLDPELVPPAGADGPAWINGRHGHALSFDTLFGTLPEDSARTSTWLEVAGGVVGQAIGDDYNEPKFMDLPRVGIGVSRAPDLRTDTNLALAQMHVLLVRFHQAAAQSLGGDELAAQRRTRRHLQAVVLTDYLRELIPQHILTDVLAGGRKIVATDSSSSDFSFEIPIEFAAACMRFGHSMVNDTYRNWIIDYPPGNGVNKIAKIEQLFHYTLSGNGLEQGQLEVHWAQFWRHMVEHDNTDLPDVVTADPIRAAVPAEFKLLNASQFPPDGTVSGGTPSFNLAVRTLQRGASLRLPTGQEMHKWIADHVDTFVTAPLDIAAFLHHRSDRFGALSSNTDFCERTPLWFYTLAEAEHSDTGKLGPVAGRVVMETFHAALEFAQDSIISVNANGETSIDFARELLVAQGPIDEFSLKDVVAVTFGGVD